jgi:L-fucose isomerase-like protein
VGRLYIGVPKAHYPNPAIDVAAERQAYQARFAELKDELSDVEFVVDELVSKPEQIEAVADKLKECDGILAVHLTLHTMPVLNAVLALGRPTIIFSAPYAGHEWFNLSGIRRQKLGENMECVLSTDYGQLAAALRPLRAMHHLREAKVLNLSASMPVKEVQLFHEKFGTEFKLVSLERVLALCEAVDEQAARSEADRWTKGATAVVEPSAEEVYKSCRVALALEKLLQEENATVMTVDCYGSMWRKIPAYPCIAFTRLNDMGLGGICQSDLPCAMVHILWQGLTGRPGFVCNPTFDFSSNSATLIHCLGSTRMDGPAGPAAPYRLRSIMEREEGATPQVQMRTGQEVTTAILDESSSALRYFTGRIVGIPDTERGCRTQITVKLDGSAETLWQNWTAGIHRVSCYGNLVKELTTFARFAKLSLVNEAV